MAWSIEDLKQLNWEDVSPPNLLMIGDSVTHFEALLLEKGHRFDDSYTGAEDVFERMMLGDLDIHALMPFYQSFCELGAHADMADMSAEDLQELMSPIISFIKPPESEGTSAATGSGETALSLGDESECSELVNFIQEALEQLEQLENQLPELRDKKADATFLNTLFRRIHTIKGASGFFGLSHLTHISHELENVLDRARNGSLDIDDEVVSVLVRGGEWMNAHLQEILQRVEDVSFPFETVIKKGASDPIYYGCMAILSRQDIEVKMEKVSTQNEEAQDTTIHISQSYLDEFIHDVGDLLNLAHIFKHSESRLVDSALDRSDVQRFKENFFALEEKTDSLQKRLMQLRRVKVKHLLDKVPKIIFRLTQVVNKKVDVKIEGEDVEIDRSMLGALEDPFVHILRNSMDHGFEMPAERVELGKPEVGLFEINVTSAQNYVTISIKDDGKGINGDIVAEKAIEKGVVSAAQVAQMSMQQKQELIFMPGFSTREAATEISGRGVGMDVVRSKIIDAGGSVSLDSTLGKGTNLMLSLPIAATLSTRALLRVSCEGQWYGVAMDKVDCISCVPRQDNDLVHSGNLELYPYRDVNIPVLNLRKLFGKKEQTESEFRSFIIVKELDAGVALEVDDFSEFETHVMQDFLEGHFDDLPFEGASVMGDGSICLTLSLDGLLAKAKLEKVDFMNQTRSLISGKKTMEKEECVLLMQPNLDDMFVSIEMSWVSRIETFSEKSLSVLKGQRIYRCNMGLLQYYELTEFGIGSMAMGRDQVNSVVMLKLGTRTIVVGIHRIEDMYTGEISFLGALSIPMLKNSWSYQDRLVGVLDMESLSQRFKPDASALLMAST